MVPEGKESTSNPTTEKNDVMLAGYRECATEALTWLLNLGYEPGHPIIRSLAAHLTKKQAYLEKLNLERFLIDETIKNLEEILNENPEEEETTEDSRYKNCAFLIKTNEEIQRSLYEAAFKGCDLHYSNDLP